MQFNKSKILCVGDVILDAYEFGAVKKISPEAPIPIFKSEKESFVLGGAGNVARNITSGGGFCHLLSVIGNDLNGNIVKNKISEITKLKANLIVEKNRKTTKKKRFISDNQQVLRVDEEVNEDITKSTEEKILKLFLKLVANFHVVVISDYNKGLLTKVLTQSLIKISRKNKKIVIVDPKRDSFSIYKGANIITPNLVELYNASKIFNNQRKNELDNIGYLSKKISQQYSIDNVITTRSSKGMYIYQNKCKSVMLESEAVEVYDVSGAGDTVVAYLALGLSVGDDLKKSAALSNKAAGISVGKFGTASVNLSELKKINFFEKIVSVEEAVKIVNDSRSKKNIGFTNGCFDLIHYGHIKYFSDIRKHCDFLVIGLNSDKSVKINKGSKRPIIEQCHRAKILACLPFIDLVILFDEVTPLSLIKKIKPELIFKGNDYLPSEVVGKEEVMGWGGKLILIDYISGLSTTEIIKRIKNEA